MQYICEVESAVRLVSRATKVRMRVSNSQCFFVIVHASTAYQHLFLTTFAVRNECFVLLL